MPLSDMLLHKARHPTSFPALYTRAPLHETPLVPVLRAVVVLVFFAEAEFVDVAAAYRGVESVLLWSVMGLKRMKRKGKIRG
jgi:hypothetical protein